MPLAFHSESHGTVAFGFFQIEIDVLVLDRLFFFADAFCAAAVSLLAKGEAARIESHIIDRPEKTGNLHGAIAGIDHSGFIGATYLRFPFPADPAGFKQNPDALPNRAWAGELMGKWGRKHRVAVTFDPDANLVSLDDYTFRAAEFHRLVEYVEQGGYPKWKNGVRPRYVNDMVAALASAGVPLTFFR